MRSIWEKEIKEYLYEESNKNWKIQQKAYAVAVCSYTAVELNASFIDRFDIREMRNVEIKFMKYEQSETNKSCTDRMQYENRTALVICKVVKRVREAEARTRMRGICINVHQVGERIVRVATNEIIANYLQSRKLAGDMSKRFPTAPGNNVPKHRICLENRCRVVVVCAHARTLKLNSRYYR